MPGKLQSAYNLNVNSGIRAIHSDAMRTHQKLLYINPILDRSVLLALSINR